MEKLFSGFPAADAAAWKERLEKDLKGITFEQLSVMDRNGIIIRPFYTTGAAARAIPGLAANPGWDICTAIIAVDAASANRAALYELNHGASGIFFDINNKVEINLLTKDIELSCIYSCFRINTAQENIQHQLDQLAKEKRLNVESDPVFLYHDYISHYLQTEDEQYMHTGKELFLELFKVTGTVGIDAGILLNAGATTTYELACSLAIANEYLQLLSEHKLTETFKKLHITFSTDTAFFEQISKLRAFRKLLQLLCSQYNCAPEVHIHVTTAQTYRSAFDSYSNLLRDTISGMAAVIGGCNSLYIPPFNESVQTDDDFGKRMSRNQQLIFREESYLDKVTDAAAGSYYIETLTGELALKAWETFKNIESDGGILASFDKGLITQHIQQQADKLVAEYREGKRVLIGVNKFPNPKDEPAYHAPEAINTGKAIRPLLLTEAILQAR